MATLPPKALARATEAIRGWREALVVPTDEELAKRALLALTDEDIEALQHANRKRARL